MTLGLTALRPARTQDADALAAIHEETWRATYRGVIDGVELERMISRRGPKWWRTALSRGVRILVLHVAGVPAGYATFGRSRMRELPFEGEIYELYVRPDHQGMGFGTELFHAARAALEKSRLSGLALRVLRDNEDAVRFYHHRGGQALMTHPRACGPDRPASHCIRLVPRRPLVKGAPQARMPRLLAFSSHFPLSASLEP